MYAIIQKWGNSLALRLPKALAKEVRITEGVQVDLVPTKEGLLLRPKRHRQYQLSELVEEITPKNIHSETEWGAPVGREILK